MSGRGRDTHGLTFWPTPFFSFFSVTSGPPWFFVPDSFFSFFSVTSEPPWFFVPRP